MDAQKLKFMMSVQLEIDKLEAELGSNHQDVVASKALFQKLSQTEIQKKKQVNSKSECCDELIPIKADTETIIDQVTRVTNKFDIIDSIIEKRASHFYNDFPTTNLTLTELKKVLIKNLELFELSLKKEDHRLASKYLIVQLEGILNLFEPELILFEEANPTRQYSQLSYIAIYKGVKTMPFRTKCNSIQTYLGIKYIAHNKVSLVYDIRNYESHQFAPDKIEESEAKLQLLKNSPTDYYEEVFKLIKQCFKSIK
ncbi:hypothetical protein [Flectobacillus longus]|uniref:hypothetical protein n=1 Tax=Flectobacillus longus TaxID=2984207 RepID=UPI0024B76628|nr:hypothetical protein [Flectobacillus longus]MDI9877931.1 hypothetical protein [Flectobacillus longus]